MEPVWRNTIGDVLRRSAERKPEQAALIFEDRRWTYRELDEATDRLARALLKLELKKGDRVAAYGRNSDGFVLLWLAAAKAGLVHVPVNYALKGEELAYILRQSGSRALFCDPDLMSDAEAVKDGGEVEVFGTIREGESLDVLRMAEKGAAEPPAVELEDTDLVQLLYTSGTTSAPKGAMMTHRALIHEYIGSIQALDFHEGDAPLHALPLYHSAQMHVFLMPYLMLGATNRLLEAPDPANVLKVLKEEGINSFFAPPTFWIALINHPDFRLDSLQKGYYGASIMPVPVLEKLREAAPELGFYNCFGQSEIGPLATVLRPEEHGERPDSAGRPVMFVEMRVVDDRMRDVGPGEMGEILYRSPQLCQGYWDKPKESEAAFSGGWFHSGDLARVDEKGYIYIVDRKKDVINTGGVLVASRDVEDAIYTHPAVQEVAVISTPDPKWIEAVTAIVVLKEGEHVEEAELIEYAKERLASFKVPKAVHFVKDLPRNASGKILKRLLREEFAKVTR
ncbi:fatty-acyl-CoA synthase [Melghirimyces profundicolus]|uniref:Fatty-acyl-CoA synthase n=1 Tax=Melghirimyces profundicolus TaxID=1242148 RepID=A0A2T6C8D0_9BACL|nr:acyl-CoA synthetase [Melghirimyces profundicolus]PTX64559.1 fatty-acyl-CoA synthase [Melghirimyces profundicolus]